MVHVLTGTMRSLVVIANPAGITGITDYAIGTYSQTVIEQAADRVVLEVASTRTLPTAAVYPVDASRLPAEAVDALVPRAGWIQSDDPAIAAQAAALVQGIETQASAVEAIVAWVRGHVVYDAAGPRDALTVLQTGRAYCVGFANLTMALLRAAGVPARGVYGCAAPWDGWGSPPQGGRHMWVEVYYPDAGWIPSDAQASANMIDTAHLVGVLDQCGKDGTTISRTEYSGALSAQDPGLVRSVATEYPSASGLPLYAAAVVPAEAPSIEVSPADVTVSLTPLAPQRLLTMEVTSAGLPATGWVLESRATWLVPLAGTGPLPGTASVEVDGRSMASGTHVGTLLVYPDAGSAAAAPRTVTVTLQMSPGALPVEIPADQTNLVRIPIVMSRSPF